MFLVSGIAVAQNALNIFLRDGGAYTYSFREKPVLTYTTMGVHLQTSSIAIDFPLYNLEKFTFANTDADAIFQVRTKDLHSDTYIYSLDGKLLRTIPTEEGSAGFSVDDLPSGIYIIKNGNVTHKISKQ